MTKSLYIFVYLLSYQLGFDNTILLWVRCAFFGYGTMQFLILWYHIFFNSLLYISMCCLLYLLYFIVIQWEYSGSLELLYTFAHSLNLNLIISHDGGDDFECSDLSISCHVWTIKFYLRLVLQMFSFMCCANNNILIYYHYSFFFCAFRWLLRIL